MPYKQHNILHGINTHFYVCHVIRVNLLSCVKSTGHQRWTCPVWYSMAPWRTVGLQTTLVKSLFGHSSLTPASCWRSCCSSGSSHPVAPCAKEYIRVPLLSKRHSTALSSSPRVTWVLESPPCYWNCTETVNLVAMACINVSSWNRSYLCNLCMIQVSPYATGSEVDPGQMQN